MNNGKREEVLAHLVKYKENRLGISLSGKWWKNKKEYPHILPEDQYAENVIKKGFHEKLLKLIGANQRHLGFHHLNSSQAMALNLFGPYVVTGKLSTLINLIGEDVIDGKGFFEKIEDKQEGTNFDFFIESAKLKFFFEVKFTEDRFGSAKNDAHHIYKYNAIYQDRLRRICSISKDEFFSDYQLWRNILYIDLWIVLFVIPRFRDDLSQKIDWAKGKINRPDAVKTLFVEDVCNHAMNSIGSQSKEHYQEFTEKYMETDIA